MSLQQAYSGYALNQTDNDDPLAKGLSAGNSAYTSSGSQGAYNYLFGQGSYPTTQTPPTPYETIHGISGARSQQSIAQAAKDAPFRGKYTSSQDLANQVQTNPSVASELINTALPAYVGYKFLMPDPAKDYIASKTGFESLGSGTKAAAAPAPAAAPTTTTTTTAAAPVAPVNTTAAAPVTPAATVTPASISAADPAYAATSTQTFLPASNGIAGATAPLNATAGEIGYVYDAATGSLAPATAEQIAAANISGGATTAAGTNAGMADLAGNAGYDTAGALGGEQLAALTAEYGPYVAAAIVADQLLFDGKISRAIDDGIIQPIGNAVEDFVGGVGEAGQGIIDAGGDILSGIGDVFGWAEGGPVGYDIPVGYAQGGISAAKRYEMGGYLDEERPKLQQYNQLGQKLDKDVSTDYELATTQRNTKKANELKNELAYRARMKKYQGRMATGGIADYNLGSYSDGGRLLKGPGDGISDSIPATIGKTKQPARLADGEFVVPARIVSELGNGSTEAGARKLYAMMDRIQSARKKSVGKNKVAVNSRADKHLPA